MDEPTKSIGTDKRASLNSFDETIIHDAAEKAQGSFSSNTGYQITREIARGGMGKVFEAIDLSLERTVAIKTILPGIDTSRFQTESRITAQLPHPSIPPVYALGYLSDGTPFLAMKLIQGVTLASILKERTSETDDVSRFVQIMEQVAQAVGFAHSQGMIHRDLKPQNIMVGSFGEIQVMDWGLAKKLGKEERFNQPSTNAMPENEATMAGTVMGTPGYMSPEQARGEPVDCRADVFSIGSMLSTVLTGSPAFVGSSAIETIQLASQGKLEDAMLRLSKPTIAPELRSIASRCLASDPAERYQNAQEVADALTAYRNGLEQRLRSMEVERATEITRQLERKKRMKVLGGAIFGAAVLSMVAYFASGHLASMNERITAVAKADAANAEETAKVLELKKQEEDLRFKLLEEIRENSAALPPVFKAIKTYADSIRNAEPLPGFSLRLNKKFVGKNGKGGVMIGLDSGGETFMMQEPFNDSQTNHSFVLRRYLNPGEKDYPKEATEGSRVRMESLFTIDNSSGNTIASVTLTIDPPTGSGTETRRVELGSVPMNNELLQIISDHLKGFKEGFEKHKHLIPAGNFEPTEDAVNAFNKGMRLLEEGRSTAATAVFGDLLAGNEKLNEYAYMTMATAFLYSGDLDMYRQCCDEMLNRFSQTEPKSDRTAKVCLLTDYAVKRMELVHSLADQIVIGTKEKAPYGWYVMAKGLSDYRAGKYEDAVHWLTVEFASKPDSQPANEQLAFVSAVLAMSYHRREDSENAKAELSKAKAIIHEKMPSIDHPDPNRKGPRSIDWLQAEILTREATSLIEKN